MSEEETQNKKQKPSIGVSLNEEDFKKLISGGVVNKSGVRIILSDIGFDRMIFALEEVMKSNM